MSCEIDTKWRTEKDGTRTCAYCGSLHPEDFTDIMWRYSQHEEGYSFGLTSKGYKRYGNRPGVLNAGDGGIKFYLNHATPEYHQEFEAAHEVAVARYKKDLRARWGQNAI